MLAVNDITMRFGGRILFEDVTTTFMEGRRYAISGPNGAGKSTFMKILTGELEPTKGSITRPKKMGVLRQDQFAFDEFRVIDTVIMGNAPLWKALEERDKLYSKPHDELTDADGMRLGELEGIVGEEGGYTAETDAAILLDGLGIDASVHERKMRELQGGQKVRVLLAQALFGNPPALLLDEPTNNLDLDSVHWLREYVLEYTGVLIVISHDRHFLNSICTHTADIDYQTIIMYNGGYDDMVLAKTQIRSRIESDNAVREKKIAQLNDFIARFSAGTRSAQATSRKKEVERLQTSELARSNIQRPYIRFQINKQSGRLPLEIKRLVKSYDDLKVIQNFSASVTRGERIALTGRNGMGKSTLLKSIIHNAGRFRLQHRPRLSHRQRQRSLGPRSHRRLFPARLRRRHRQKQRRHRHRVALAIRSAIVARRTTRPARSNALQRRRRPQSHQSAQRRRNRPAAFLQADAAKAQRPGLRRTHQ